MPTKPTPLPKPSTNHDLTNISSKDHLAIWDTYARAVLVGTLTFHGTNTAGSDKAAARYAATTADELMELRQERAQGHVDQGIVERAKAKEAKQK